MLLTVRAKIAFVCRGLKGPLSVMAIVKSADAVTVVTSDAMSFAVFASPPPLTVAVLAIVAGAFSATFTVKVMMGKLAPEANESFLMHVNVASVHAHPLPENAVAVRPPGNTSTTVTAVAVGPGPTLVTVNV